MTYSCFYDFSFIKPNYGNESDYRSLRGILIKCIMNIPDLDECEYLGNVLQGADIDQGESLEERAGPDDHQQLGEQVKVCLEMLHGSVVHKLLANLPGGGPPEEHIDQQQKENGGVEYG